DRGADRTRLVAQGKMGRLRIAFSETATHGGELSSILRQFRAGWPDVQLELFPGTSISAGEQLRNQEVDLALVYIPPTNLPELGHHAASVDRMVLALPGAHPLAKSKRLTLRDLRGEPFVFFPRTANSHVYDRVLSACHTAGVTLKIVQEVNSDTTMLNLVA